MQTIYQSTVGSVFMSLDIYIYVFIEVISDFSRVQSTYNMDKSKIHIVVKYTAHIKVL